MKTWIAAALLALPSAATAQAPAIPAAIYTDPTPDKAHPAAMEVVHIPSGGVRINGVVYVAAGAGPHPTVVLCHGLPGLEKNLDLADVLRQSRTDPKAEYRCHGSRPGRRVEIPGRGRFPRAQPETYNRR